MKVGVAFPLPVVEPTGLDRFTMRVPPPGYRWNPKLATERLCHACRFDPRHRDDRLLHSGQIIPLPPPAAAVLAQHRLARAEAATPAKRSRQLEDLIANARNAVSAWSEGAINPPGWEPIALKYLDLLEKAVTP